MADQPIRVLLIDDDEDDCVIVQGLLSEPEGAHVDLDWVLTYEEGMDAIVAGKYDVYLVDYRLGERSGLDLLGDAVARGHDVPIILLTGQGNLEVDMTAMEAGAADYLVKGQITGPILERTIRHSLQRRRDRPDPTGPEVTWRPGDLLLQAALARGASVPEAARTARVSERTVYRRLADADFRKEVARLREDLRSRLVDEIAQRMVDAPDQRPS
jgi:DNA-binding response OmpR family regulator